MMNDPVAQLKSKQNLKQFGKRNSFIRDLGQVLEKLGGGKYV
jgi:hypothetical protein